MPFRSWFTLSAACSNAASHCTFCLSNHISIDFNLSELLCCCRQQTHVVPGQKGHLLIIKLVDQESNIEIEGKNTDTSTHTLSNSSYSNKAVLLLNYYYINFVIACIILIYLLEILFHRFFQLTHPFQFIFFLKHLTLDKCSANSSTKHPVFFFLKYLSTA